jgi:hypothetical protein
LSVVALVPAYNEAPRLGPVLDVLVRHPGIAQVLVIDDGSTDDTASVARAHGAEVLTLRPNRGKGGAMLAGLRASSEPVVLFADADLVGLTPEHVSSMIDPVVEGSYAMVVGLRDYGFPWTEITRDLPLISGERAVRRDLLEQVPPEGWRGFSVEVYMNDVAARHSSSFGPTGTVVLPGLSIVKKWEKNPERGAYDMLRMATEVTNAMVEARRDADRRASLGAGPTDLAKAPPPASVSAECSTTQCVADTVVESAIRKAGPFVRDELWTPEAQTRVGDAVGQRVSRPLWIGAGILGWMAAGPLGLLGVGLLWTWNEWPSSRDE